MAGKVPRQGKEKVSLKGLKSLDNILVSVSKATDHRLRYEA